MASVCKFAECPAPGRGSLPLVGVGGISGVEAGMLKRHADYLEKLSVAAMVMGLFHGYSSGVILGIACYTGCVYLTRRIGG